MSSATNVSVHHVTAADLDRIYVAGGTSRVGFDVGVPVFFDSPADMIEYVAKLHRLTAASSLGFAYTLWQTIDEALHGGEADRFAAVHSWDDLDDVCDANDFVIETSIALGMDLPDPDQPEYESYMSVVNDAIDTINRLLGRRDQ